MKPCRKCGSTERRKDRRCVGCASIQQAKWRAANQERIRQYRTAYNEANPHKELEYRRRYRAMHPDKISAKNAKRRALKLSLRCTCCTDAQIATEYALARVLGLEVDHIKPLALGGLHCAKNLQSLNYEVEHKPKTRADIRAIAARRSSDTSEAA